MTTAKKPLPAAVELGRRGGKARVANLTKEEIRELGRRGGEASCSSIERAAAGDQSASRQSSMGEG